MRAAILAGGQSSRFNGQPKGLERVGGERILDRVAESLQAATGESPLLIANAPEADQWQPGLHVVGDAIRDCGSLGGIYTAVTAGEGPVLLCAWDMPFVSTTLLEDLIDGAEGYDAFLPESKGPRGVEPLCGVYGERCLDAIRERIAEEDLRSTGFHDAVNLGKLPLLVVEGHGDPATLFFNVNTPEDLVKAQDLWRREYQ